MAKFTFPMSFEQFKSAVQEKEDIFAEALSVDRSEAIAYAYSCLRQGWMSKQYHKEKQQRDQELTRLIRERMKNDPELEARLRGHEVRKGATSRK